MVTIDKLQRHLTAFTCPFDTQQENKQNYLIIPKVITVLSGFSTTETGFVPNFQGMNNTEDFGKQLCNYGHSDAESFLIKICI